MLDLSATTPIGGEFAGPLDEPTKTCWRQAVFRIAADDRLRAAHLPNSKLASGRHEPDGARRSSRSKRYAENRATEWPVPRMKRTHRIGGIQRPMLAIAAVQTHDHE